MRLKYNSQMKDVIKHTRANSHPCNYEPQIGRAAKGGATGAVYDDLKSCPVIGKRECEVGVVSFDRGKESPG